MATHSRLITIAVSALVIIVVAMVLTSRKATLSETKTDAPPERRLIESLHGRDLFEAYCASCHGQDGKGGGPAASALKAAVPDLTRIRQRAGGKFPFERIQKIIAGEDAKIPAHGSREMPIWGPQFSQIAWDQDLAHLCIYNLTKYLESIQRD